MTPSSTYGQALDAARLDTIAKLGLLSDTVRVYMELAHVDDPAAYAAVLQTMAQLAQSQSTVDAQLVALVLMAQNLPPMNAEVTIGSGWVLDPAGFHWMPLTVRVTGAGILRSTPPTDLELALQEDWLTLFEDSQYCFNAPRRFSDGLLRNMSLEGVATITSGPNVGLSDVTFRFQARVYGSLQAFHLRLIDDLQRIGLYSIIV